MEKKANPKDAHPTDYAFPGSSSQPKNSSFSILVLDSNYALDPTLENFLKAEGYPILVAASAKEAISKTRQFEPDLILLDCELKGLNCLSLLPELMAEHPGAAVILLASRPSVSNVVEAIKLGALDFFERPLDLKKLKLAIEQQKAFIKAQWQGLKG